MKLRTLLLLSSLLLLLCQCGTQRINNICSRCPVKTETVIERYDSVITSFTDTTIYLPPDSAWYYALVECVNNKPVINNANTTNSRRTKVSVQLADNRLQVNCIALYDSVVLLQKQVQHYRSQHSVKNNTVIKTIKQPLAWWQKILIWLGAAFIAEWLLRLAFWAGKKYANLSLPFLKL